MHLLQVRYIPTTSSINYVMYRPPYCIHTYPRIIMRIILNICVRSYVSATIIQTSHNKAGHRKNRKRKKLTENIYAYKIQTHYNLRHTNIIPAANGIYVNKFLKRKDVRYGLPDHNTVLYGRLSASGQGDEESRQQPLPRIEECYAYDRHEPLSSVCVCGRDYCRFNDDDDWWFLNERIGHDMHVIYLLRYTTVMAKKWYSNVRPKLAPSGQILGMKLEEGENNGLMGDKEHRLHILVYAHIAIIGTE